MDRLRSWFQQQSTLVRILILSSAGTFVACCCIPALMIAIIGGTGGTNSRQAGRVTTNGGEVLAVTRVSGLIATRTPEEGQSVQQVAQRVATPTPPPVSPTVLPTSTPTEAPTSTPTPVPPQVVVQANSDRRVVYDRPLGDKIGQLCFRDTVNVLSYQLVGNERWLQVQRMRAGTSCFEPVAWGKTAWLRQADLGEPSSSIEEYVQAIGATPPTVIPATATLLPPTPRPTARPTARPAPRPTARPAPPSGGGGRIGAICRDGSHSNATGRGACSHHGGVDHWLYGP